MIAALALAAFSAAACPPEVVGDSGTGKVPLFSSLPLEASAFGQAWAKALPGLRKEFPTLRLEKPENLHITIAFMGVKDWDPKKAPDMEKLALDGPNLSSGPVAMKGSPDIFGPKKHVAVWHLAEAPKEWGARVVRDLAKMTELGLRKKDAYDDAYKPHVSLAFAAKPEEQQTELARFEKRLLELKLPPVVIDHAVKPALFVALGKDDTTRFVTLASLCK